ncbi:putative metalloprotease CJM1_0395 family protein [Pseudoalteromonas sp. T1lg65]|uniref:putative metalloprotease CJM1_0395 family protein n=1 Tax=Pseudoalteromonas sp. T1lg65 TaxID=2077101 RepID=UPI003F79D6CC
MNIVTPPPAMNLNTANVHTESAARDNQLREIIPKAAPTSSPFTENKNLADSEKNRSAHSDDGKLYNSSGKPVGEKKVEGKSEKEEGDKERNGSEKEQQQAEQDEQVIQELKSRDREVRLHEQAHARVGGQHAGSPSYEYQRGPDGNNYAIGGQVMIDVAPIEGDPQATIEKMQTVRAAALAPAEPSGADRAIAADATQKLSAAQAELAKQSISGEEESNNKNKVPSIQTRRLSGEIATAQSDEEAKLKQDADPYSVAMPIEPDPEIQARALRISQFYQHVAQPNQVSSLSVQI